MIDDEDDRDINRQINKQVNIHEHDPFPQIIAKFCFKQV